MKHTYFKKVAVDTAEQEMCDKNKRRTNTAVRMSVIYEFVRTN